MEKKIYLSLPITGIPYEEVCQRADLLKARLSRQGYEVISPIELYAGEKPEYEDYIGNDVKELMKCDGIYLCRGWQLSCGCTIEYNVAIALKKFKRPEFKIIYEV